MCPGFKAVNGFKSTQTLLVLEGLLAQAKANLNLNEGEYMVWLAESPTIPDQPATTVMIAQSWQQTKEAGQKQRILGVCEIVNGAGESAYEAKTSIEPTANANAEAYMYDYEGKEMHFGYGEGTKEYIVQQPKHGVLIDGYYPAA